MSDGFKLQCIATATFSSLLSCFVVLHFCSEYWQFDHFKSPYDPYNLFYCRTSWWTGACSHLGATGPKVGGALAPPALWLPRPCSDTLWNLVLSSTPALTDHVSDSLIVRTNIWNVTQIQCFRLETRAVLVTVACKVQKSCSRCYMRLRSG